METQVVQVRAIEDANRKGRFICGQHPETKEPFVWNTQVTVCAVPVSILAELEASPWLSVQRLDAHMQAAKRFELALAADAEATEAEAKSRALRAKADALLSEAQAAQEVAGSTPAPPAPPAPTPFHDQLRAALPDSVRKQVDEQKLSIQQVREELLAARVNRASALVGPKPGGTFDQAKAQAVGDAPKSAKKP